MREAQYLAAIFESSGLLGAVCLKHRHHLNHGRAETARPPLCRLRTTRMRPAIFIRYLRFAHNDNFNAD